MCSWLDWVHCDEETSCPFTLDKTTSDCCWWLVMVASRVTSLYNRCGGRCLDDNTFVVAEYGIHFSSPSLMHWQRTNIFYSFIHLTSLGHSMTPRHTHFFLEKKKMEKMVSLGTRRPTVQDWAVSNGVVCYCNQVNTPSHALPHC